MHVSARGAELVRAELAAMQADGSLAKADMAAVLQGGGAGEREPPGGGALHHRALAGCGYSHRPCGGAELL